MAKKKEEQTIDYEAMAKEGFEGVKADDMGTPFLSIVQKLSPQLNAKHAKYIEDVEEGCIINTATGEIIGGEEDAVIVIPCGYQKMYVEWKPRESGGGFVMAHPDVSILSECTKNDRNQDILKNGNLIATTAYFFCMYETKDGTWSKAVIGFTSTQLKKSRQWLTMMASIKFDGSNGKFTPPMFSHKYAIVTVPEKNAGGEWYGWKIESAGMVNDAKLIDSARETKQLVGAGIVKQLEAHESDELPF